MRNMLFLLLFLLLIITAKSQSGAAFADSAHSFHLFEARDLTIDFKFIDPAKGSFGIDYLLNLKRSLKAGFSDDSIIRPHLNLNLLSKGFLTVKGDANQFNSIINELNLELSPVMKQRKVHGTQNIIDELQQPDEAIIQKTREQAAMVSSPFWLMLNVHGKHEATQDFKSYDVAFGSSLSFTTSYLNSILDYPFGLLRVAKNNNPRQADLAIVYDFITGLNNTPSKELRTNYNASRFSFNAEWETGIFKNERISFLYKSFYEVNPPELIRENKLHKNYYYQIKLEHPLSKPNDKTRKTVSIKYSQGALPPDFTKGNVLGGGFTIEL